MRRTTRVTIGKDLFREIARTRGESSMSERVNALLARALVHERREQMEREAAKFYLKQTASESRERRAYQEAAKVALSRD